MSLVEEENELRFVRIAHFRQRFEQFGQQPEKEGGVELRALHQPVGGQDIDLTAALRVDLHQIGNLQRRFPEKPRAALRFQLQQCALDGAHAGGGNIAVSAGQFLAVGTGPKQQRLQIGQIEQQQPLVIRRAKGNLQNAGLRIVELQQAAEQQRPHFGNGGAYGMALFAEQIPENDRIVGIGIVIIADVPRAAGERFVQFAIRRAGHGHARQIAFHIGQENGHALPREAFRQTLQRDRLPGAGCACDQAMAIGPAQVERLRFAAGLCLTNEDRFAAIRYHPITPESSMALGGRSLCTRKGPGSVKRPGP